MKYEVFEHKSDVGLSIYGSSFSELLENAGSALFELMADVSDVRAVESMEITARGDNAEELFMAWLRELLYIFHGESCLLKEFEVIEVGNNSVKGVVKGEKIDPERHVLHGEVKGVTYHNLEVKEVGGRWEARVIMDV